MIEWRGKPLCIGCDNGPKYISQHLAEWARKKQINLPLKDSIKETTPKVDKKDEDNKQDCKTSYTRTVSKDQK